MCGHARHDTARQVTSCAIVHQKKDVRDHASVTTFRCTDLFEQLPGHRDLIVV